MASHLASIVFIDKLTEEYGEFPIAIALVSITILAALIVNHLFHNYLAKHLEEAGCAPLRY